MKLYALESGQTTILDFVNAFPREEKDHYLSQCQDRLTCPLHQDTEEL